MRSDPWLTAALAPYHQTLSFVVHASSKIGKTTLAATAPKPLLLLDSEGGTKFLNLRKVYWDPMLGPPPECDGTWEACVVVVRHYETMTMAYQWLAMGQHCFASLSIDSLTEVQRRCKENLVGTEAMKQQAWGQLLDKMLVLVRSYRDLTLHPTNPFSVVTFIAETKMMDGKWRAYFQGQLAATLPYTVDMLGYLYVADVADPYDPLIIRKQRQLLIGPDATIEAGERVQGRLGHVVTEPNLEQMLYTVYQQPTPPQAAAIAYQGAPQ